jgi:hypothetical protein
LQGNTQIEELCLTARFVAEEQLVNLLLQFLRNSPSMREFDVSGWEEIPDVIRRVFLAIAQNRNIQKLTLGRTTVPAESLAELLRDTESLKELRIEDSSSFALTRGPVLDILTSGFERNGTLEVLATCDVIDAHVITLLNAAASLPRLRELELIPPSGDNWSSELGHTVASSGSLETLRVNSVAGPARVLDLLRWD